MESDDDLIPGIDVPARNIPELNVACVNLVQNFQDIDGKTSLIAKHLDTYIQENPLPPISFKDTSLEWFNVSEPLSFEEHLNSHIVVLDFFTYCCINCLHILPDLEALEEKYTPNSSPVIVVGIHSGKFENERLTKYASDAIKRNNINHPVANDGKCKLWHYLGISCWPTLLIVGPGSLPLFVLMGEGNRNILFEFVNESIKYFEKMRPLIPKPLPLSPLLHLPSRESDLYYPGKLEVLNTGLIISDSGNNRIIIINWEGEIEEVIGSGKRGSSDGHFVNASFRNPQGIAFLPPSIIFVADTDNHTIRKINLEKKTVETIAGTGYQSSDKEGGHLSKEQGLSSPWDLCLGHSLDADKDSPPNLLLIAMAGSHQIWGLFLTDGHWLKKSFYPEGTVVCLAGSGLEENRNTSYPLKAGFAQPSGITILKTCEGEVVFIADSESSSIRQFSLASGSVKRVSGGSVNPLDLFAYGDEDGAPNEAKFQHPLGVTAYENRIYVADSYNHKIKLLRKENKTYITETLSWNEESVDNSKEDLLNEPGGLCVSNNGQYLYIADTNNFCVKEYNIENGKIRQIRLKFLNSEEKEPTEDTVDSGNQIIFYLPQKENLRVNLNIKLDLPPHIHLNPEVKQKYSFVYSDNVKILRNDILIDLENTIPVEVDMTSEVSAVIRISSKKLILCSEKGMCFMKECHSAVQFLQTDNDNTDFNFDLILSPNFDTT